MAQTALDSLLGLATFTIGAGILLKTFDLLTDAKKEQKRMKKKGVKTKIIKNRGKYQLKKVI